MNVKVVTVELGKFLKKEDRDYEEHSARYRKTKTATA